MKFSRCRESNQRQQDEEREHDFHAQLLASFKTVFRAAIVKHRLDIFLIKNLQRCTSDATHPTTTRVIGVGIGVDDFSAANMSDRCL